MKKTCTALVLLLLMIPALALSSGPKADALSASDEVALDLLDQVFETEKPDEQIALLRKAAAAAPDNVDIQVSCAQLLFYLDETGVYADECLALLSAALQKAEGSQKAYVVQALSEQLTYWDRSEEALPILEEVIAQAPENESLKTTMASVLYYSGEKEKAIAYLEDLIEDAPDNREARRLHATVLLDECRYEEALAAYTQIGAQWPEYLDGMMGMYVTYVAMGEFEQGVRMMDMILANGGDDTLWLDRARLRLWNQQRPEAALEEAEALLRMDPEWVDAAAVKLVAQTLLDDFDGALETARSVSQVDAAYGDLLTAIITMDEGDFSGARELLTQIIDENPDYHPAYKILSTARLDGYDDIAGAGDALADAFSILGEAGDFDLYMRLGHFYSRQGMLLEAARAYTVADKSTYDDPSALYYVLLTCVEAGRMENAWEVLSEMERRYPGWYETMFARMQLEDENRQAQRAMEAFEALEEKFPFPMSRVPELRGMIMADLGDAEGIPLIEGAISSADEPDPALYFALSYAHLKLSDAGAAQAAYDTAVGLLDDTDEPDGMPAKERSERISLHLMQADLLLHADNVDGAIESFMDAARLGWSPLQLPVHEDYGRISAADGFDALMALAPGVSDDWDLTAPPPLPAGTQSATEGSDTDG